MIKKKRIIIGRVCARDKPLRKVGLDTDIVLIWFENQKIVPTERISLIKRGDALYINYKVFAELFGKIRERYPEKKKKDITREIFTFMRKNNINMIKKKNMSLELLNRIKKVLEQLNKEKSKWNENPGKSDLEIIAIYYCTVDCIFSRNKKHFEEPCNFLNIHLEVPYNFAEIGSPEDVNKQLRRFRKRY